MPPGYFLTFQLLGWVFPLIFWGNAPFLLHQHKRQCLIVSYNTKKSKPSTKAFCKSKITQFSLHISSFFFFFLHCYFYIKEKRKKKALRSIIKNTERLSSSRVEMTLLTVALTHTASSCFQESYNLQYLYLLRNRGRKEGHQKVKSW